MHPPTKFQYGPRTVRHAQKTQNSETESKLIEFDSVDLSSFKFTLGLYTLGLKKGTPTLSIVA